MNTGIVGATLATATIWRLPMFTGVCVWLRPFADCASAMTLEMTLDVKDFRGGRVGAWGATLRGISRDTSPIDVFQNVLNISGSVEDGNKQW